MQGFLQHAEAHGLLIRDLVPDNQWHRVPTTDHKRKRNGAYIWDGHHGAVQNWAMEVEPSPWRPDRESEPLDCGQMRRKVREAAADLERRQAAARGEAQRIIESSTPQKHEYLARKGFPEAVGLVYNDDLVIPMREFGKPVVNGVQTITPDGHKLFLPGTKAKGSAFVIGIRDPKHWWLCEGYATGLSVQAALRDLRKQSSVVVCFSAGNIIEIASRCPKPCFVMADNDASQTGKLAAEKTGLPWVMPPDVGQDCNDLHLARGLRAVCKLMLEVL